MPRKNVPVPVPPGSKYCHGCQSVHPHGGFHSNRTQPDGLASQCKGCARASRHRAKEMQRLVEDGIAEMRDYFQRRPLKPYEWPVAPMSVANR